MSLFDKALTIMELKPYWAERETVDLWKSGSSPRQMVYLKCGGGYVNLMAKVGLHEIPHGFAVGIFDGYGLFEPFKLATEDAYSRWTQKTNEQIVHFKKVIAAQHEQTKDALWVTEPPTKPIERSENQVDMYKTELFPYIEGGALVGKQVTVTMTFLRTEELASQGGQKETSYILHFKETEKGLILNKTNAKRIIGLYGRETDEWRDKRITLYTEEVQAFGKKHNAIRVLDRVPPVNGNGSKPSLAKDIDENLDDLERIAGRLDAEASPEPDHETEPAKSWFDEQEEAEAEAGAFDTE